MKLKAIGVLRVLSMSGGLFFFFLVFKMSSRHNTTSELMKQAAFLSYFLGHSSPRNENSVIIHCWSFTVLQYSLKRPKQMVTGKKTTTEKGIKCPTIDRVRMNTL